MFRFDSSTGYPPLKRWKLSRPSTPDTEETLQASLTSERSLTPASGSSSSCSTLRTDTTLTGDQKCSLPKAAPTSSNVPSEQVLNMIKMCLRNESVLKHRPVLKTAHLANLTEELLALTEHGKHKALRFSEPLVTFRGPSCWDYYWVSEIERIRQELEQESLPTVDSDPERFRDIRSSLDSVDSQELERHASINENSRKLQQKQTLDFDDQISTLTVDSNDDLWLGPEVSSKKSKLLLRHKPNFEKLSLDSFDCLNGEAQSIHQQVLEWKKQLQPVPLRPILKRKSKFFKENDEIHFISPVKDQSFVEISDTDSISESTITGASFIGESISVESGSDIMFIGEPRELEVGLSVASPVTLQKREFSIQDGIVNELCVSSVQERPATPLPTTLTTLSRNSSMNNSERVNSPLFNSEQFINGAKAKSEDVPSVPLVLNNKVDRKPSPKPEKFDSNYIKNVYQKLSYPRETFRSSLEVYRASQGLKPRVSVDSRPAVFELFGIAPVNSKAHDCTRCEKPKQSISPATTPCGSPLPGRVSLEKDIHNGVDTFVPTPTIDSRQSIEFRKQSIDVRSSGSEPVHLGTKPKRSKVKRILKKLCSLF